MIYRYHHKIGECNVRSVSSRFQAYVYGLDYIYTIIIITLLL